MIMIFGTLVLNDNTSRCLFNFLKFSFFGLLVGIKGLKIAQSEKNKQLHRTRAISQEQYNICSSFLVHLCKMISPGYHFTQVKFWQTFCHMCKRIIYLGVIFLHSFQILIFGVSSGAKEQKKMPEMRKIFVCASTPYLSMHISYDCVFCCTSLK